MRLKTALILLFVAGCLVLLAIFRIHSFAEPLDRDESYYAVIGREILLGKWPYADFWSNTPPAIHLLYAAGIKLLGYTEQSVRLLGLGFSLVTAVGLFLLATRCASAYGGCLALLLFALTSSDPRLHGNSTNCEIPMNAFLVWSYYFLAIYMNRRSLWKAALAGLLLGLAALVKTVAIAPFTGGLILLFIGWNGGAWKRRIVDAVAYSLLAALPWILCMAVFWFAGRFESLWDCVFRFNQQYYAKQQWSEMPLTFVRNTRALALTWPFWAVAAVWLIRSAPWTNPARTRDFSHLLTAVWLLSTVFEITLPGKYWAHYYYLQLPPCLLLMAILTVELQKLRGMRAIGLALVLSGAIAYVAVREYTDYLRLDPAGISETKYGDRFFVEARRIGQLLGREVPEEEKIFNWGTDTELYFYSGRRPAARFLVNYPITYSQQGFLVEELVQELKEGRPDMIVISDAAPDALQRLLDQDYNIVARQGFFIFYTRVRSVCAP